MDLLDDLVAGSLLRVDTRGQPARFSLGVVGAISPEEFDLDQVDRLRPELDDMRSALRWTIEKGAG